ncbi:thermonuclease family protein [Thermodesulfovibrionales bacterium]|nr:thermonuclease family protein [Thermodesulfovibrionales bacterium]
MKLHYYTGIFILILAIAIIFLYFNASYIDTKYGTRFYVSRVDDGDSVSIRKAGFWGILSGTESVRLIGIDAPELGQEPWGNRSKRHLQRLINKNGGVVNIEFDVKQRDRYERLLAYLWGGEGDMINERMIEDGYAVLLTIPPNVRYTERFKTAQRKARLQRAGFWKYGGLNESPRQWRMKHPGN